MNRKFVPDDFKIPDGYVASDFKVRPLLITDVVKDYDAVITSLPEIKTTFGLQANWTQRELTFEQDLIDLGWHHKEFQDRKSFAYTVMALDESKCLGCVYIHPCDKNGYDAEAYCWVRTSHRFLDDVLYQSFRDWLAKEWPFKSVAFPGRAINWQSWAKLEPM